MRQLDLQAQHQAAGALLGERQGFQQVERFGSDAGAVASELGALLDGAALLDHSSRDLFALTGPDRESFLHGQTTNDVKGLAVGQGHAAALLTPRGKMLGVDFNKGLSWVGGSIGLWKR